MIKRFVFLFEDTYIEIKERTKKPYSKTHCTYHVSIFRHEAYFFFFFFWLISDLSMLGKEMTSNKNIEIIFLYDSILLAEWLGQFVVEFIIIRKRTRKDHFSLSLARFLYMYANTCVLL